MGRLPGSKIRQNIIEILYHMKHGYGYDIHQVYVDLFPAVTMRSIYYHLRKGVNLGEFTIHKIKKESGSYSWGPTAEKIYYSLGPKAKPKMLKTVMYYIDKRKKFKKK